MVSAILFRDSEVTSVLVLGCTRFHLTPGTGTGTPPVAPHVLSPQAGQILQLDVFPLRAPGWGLRLRTLCIAPPAPRGLDGAEKRGLGGWILVPHLLWRVPPSRPCFIFASFFQLEPRVVRGYRLSEGFAGTFGWCCSAFAFLWSFSHAEDKLLRS